MNARLPCRSPAQLGGHPPRRFYTGGNLERAVALGDLRARAHRRMPRFALEYLEGGAEDEATLTRERAAFHEWRFAPRTLVDAVLAGRAPLYGLCASGTAGVTRALEILNRETCDAMGLLGVSRLQELGPHLLAASRTAAPSAEGLCDR